MVHTGRAIVKTVCAFLRLLSCSSDLLSVSQLSATRAELRDALAIVEDRITSETSGLFSGNVFWVPSSSPVFCR